MESMIIWGVTILLALAIFIPSFVRFRLKRKQDIKRMEEAAELGLQRPMGQYPFIDVVRCIGCGSCVTACPEGDVLGIVFGKALIINGLRCVGHGYCQDACPVMAIEVGMGNTKEREDIPVLSEHYETNIPGLYIAGELTGLSLIRNAVKQGREVVQAIARSTGKAGSGDVFDVVVVGFGPAGLSAGLAAQEAKLSVMVLDQQAPGGTLRQYPNRKLVMTQDLDLPLYGRLKGGEYSKEHLLKLWDEIMQRFPINIRMKEQVQSVRRSGDGLFTLSTASGSFRAHRVVLAMGRRGTPRKLNVPGEEQAKVMYQLVDAQSYHDKYVLIVGGGDSAIESAIGLARQKGNKVAISYRKDQFYRIKKKNEDRITELIKKRKVTTFFNSEVLQIQEGSVIIQVGEKKLEIPNHYVFVHIGGEPPYKFLREIGVQFGEKAGAKKGLSG